MDSLFNLYELVDIGGYVICDDCGSLFEADRAIQDFRSLHGITDTLIHAHGEHEDWEADWRMVAKFWRKTAAPAVRHDLYQSWGRQRKPYDLDLYCQAPRPTPFGPN